MIICIIGDSADRFLCDLRKQWKNIQYQVFQTLQISFFFLPTVRYPKIFYLLSGQEKQQPSESP